MDAASFVQHLARSRPARADDEHLSWLDAQLACRPRAHPSKPSRDALEDLVARYDCSALAIGRVRFVKAPRPHFAGVMVGFAEAEPLVLTRSSELWTFEGARFGDPIQPCAANGATFLAALCQVLDLVWERARWVTDLDAAAACCAEAAGGARYQPFFMGLCGFLEYGWSRGPTVRR